MPSIATIPVISGSWTDLRSKTPGAIFSITSVCLALIGAVILGLDTLVVAGAKVHLTGKVVEIPVGEELIGRVVDPLGNPLDDKGPINAKQTVQKQLVRGIVLVQALVSLQPS